ncbi:hypothetical protein N7508_005151 [Penicillium antarcticum]|nr:uncharacterized protein N7508_005151 [Penicillium antarcticum]KAJ5306136.1 hypothetical protein N7508_005151 [Penicillium antarcticum]
MAIESRIALATIVSHRKDDDLQAAFQSYQDLGKPRTDRVTNTSFEAGNLVSSDDLDHLSDKFNPDALIERMRWIREYNVLDHLKVKGADYMEYSGSRI